MSEMVMVWSIVEQAIEDGLPILDVLDEHGIDAEEFMDACYDEFGEGSDEINEIIWRL